MANLKSISQVKLDHLLSKFRANILKKNETTIRPLFIGTLVS